jgi:hypothetical protein
MSQIFPLKVGDCFRTKNDQIRRITAIENGLVNYEQRGSKSHMPWAPGPNKSSLPTEAKFREQVKERVRCDWDADHHNQPPV